MAHPVLIVDDWTYEGTDAHRTMLHLGDLWLHHVHGASPASDVEHRSAESLAAMFSPLAGVDDASLPPYERVKLLGERAAGRIDVLDRGMLERALREMWMPLAALTTGTSPTAGIVTGLFLSDGGVPKTAVDAVEVGYRGVAGDRQATRVHHGRPWQALCLWSADVVAEFAAQGHPIRPGSAGENVSIRGLEWSAVRPGVRVTLGTTTITITAYAIPCHKNARWFGDGDYERMSHERGTRSRVYARVDVPGRIIVGDRAQSAA
jgi:hypothetical protein